jgi:hypothetical protein
MINVGRFDLDFVVGIGRLLLEFIVGDELRNFKFADPKEMMQAVKFT